MNRVLRIGSVSVSLVLTMLAAGCGGSVAVETPAATAEGAATKAAVAVNTHGHVKLAGEALSEVPLRADQRVQIEKLASDADSLQSAVRAAHHDLMGALADQVAAGQIDRTALQPKIDAIATAALGAQTADRAALVQLHGILDPSQRSLFVDTLESKVSGHGHGHMHMGGHSWQDRWADLNLTEAQTAQIESILHESFASHHGDWKGAFANGKAMLEAFRGESFNIDQASPAMDVRAKTTERTGKLLDLAQRVLPILTADQRATASQKLKTRATATPEAEEKSGDPLF
jgi:Spy/CpxP family protein refolding chaperone